jgi:hypothetical protein
MGLAAGAGMSAFIVVTVQTCRAGRRRGEGERGEKL